MGYHAARSLRTVILSHPLVPADETDPGSLDVDHLAELANLELDEGEREQMAQACREVLSAFQLEDLGDETQAPAPVRTFPDEPEPWPEDGIEAIVRAFPDRDGRSLRP